MTEATGGRKYYNCQWAQEDVKTLYNLLNNNNNNNNNNKNNNNKNIFCWIIYCEGVRSGSVG
jgi:hypothetical protein